MVLAWLTLEWTNTDPLMHPFRSLASDIVMWCEPDDLMVMLVHSTLVAVGYSDEVDLMLVVVYCSTPGCGQIVAVVVLRIVGLQWWALLANNKKYMETYPQHDDCQAFPFIHMLRLFCWLAGQRRWNTLKLYSIAQNFVIAMGCLLHALYLSLLVSIAGGTHF